MTDWQRFDIRGRVTNVASEYTGDSPYTLRVFGWGHGWRAELYKGLTLHRATVFLDSSPDGSGLDDALKAAEHWSIDAKRDYNGWRGGWNTWHLALENGNDQGYYNDYMELVREYNDALADNPDFNQESIREALSRHLLQIITHSDADYVLHHIDFDELWEVFLSNAKEAREYDDKR